jgi:2-oxo-3-hexenedioate decarboxylase
VEAEIARRRTAEGRQVAGFKVGYANKAVWRALKLDTLVWAHMYDDTVHDPGSDATLAIAPMFAPKIEPEIVFCMRGPLQPGTSDPVTVLDAVEWIALGFEIIDCVFPDWKFTPIDFVASKGLHAGLFVGTHLAVTETNRAALAEQLASFTVTLERNGEKVAEGSGRNALRNPALAVAELATAMASRATGEALQAGSLVSSGTLTESQLLHSGEQWAARVEGLPLPPTSLRIG